LLDNYLKVYNFMCESYELNLYDSFFMVGELNFEDILIDNMITFFSKIDEFEICDTLKKIKLIRHKQNKLLGF